MKVTIVTAIWKRHNLFPIFVEGVRRLQRAIPELEINVVVVGSEGRFSRDLVKQHKGFIYVETPNHPLGNKLNQGVIKAMDEKIPPDYLLMMGSDDIMNDVVLRWYMKYMKKGYDMISILDCYFFDTKSKRAVYWAGYRTYRRGRPIGVGRLMSRELITSLGWQPWDPKAKMALDSTMDARLANKTYKHMKVRLKAIGGFVLDIKSTDNITPFANWDNSTPVEPKTMLIKNLDFEFAETIYNHKV